MEYLSWKLKVERTDGKLQSERKQGCIGGQGKGELQHRELSFGVSRGVTWNCWFRLLAWCLVGLGCLGFLPHSLAQACPCSFLHLWQDPADACVESAFPARLHTDGAACSSCLFTKYSLPWAHDRDLDSSGLGPPQSVAPKQPTACCSTLGPFPGPLAPTPFCLTLSKSPLRCRQVLQKVGRRPCVASHSSRGLGCPVTLSEGSASP